MKKIFLFWLGIMLISASIASAGTFTFNTIPAHNVNTSFGYSADGQMVTYANTTAIMLSTDSGQNFSIVRNVTNNDYPVMSLSGEGDVIGGGSERTLYLSHDYGNTWETYGTDVYIIGDYQNARVGEVADDGNNFCWFSQNTTYTGACYYFGSNWIGVTSTGSWSDIAVASEERILISSDTPGDYLRYGDTPAGSGFSVAGNDKSWSGVGLSYNSTKLCATSKAENPSGNYGIWISENSKSINDIGITEYTNHEGTFYNIGSKENSDCDISEDGQTIVFIDNTTIYFTDDGGTSWGNQTFEEVHSVKITSDGNNIMAAAGPSGFIKGTYQSCTPDWTCTGYEDCQSDDLQHCNSVVDNSICDLTYYGDYSEFTPLTCDYCTPNWVCSGYGTCQPDDQQQCNTVTDTNDCGESYTGDYSEFEIQECTYSSGGGSSGGGGAWPDEEEEETVEVNSTPEETPITQEKTKPFEFGEFFEEFGVIFNKVISGKANAKDLVDTASKYTSQLLILLLLFGLIIFAAYQNKKKSNKRGRKK